MLPTVLAWLVCVGAELVLARTLAGDYAELRPWAWTATRGFVRGLRRGAGGLDRQFDSGGGCLAVVALMLGGPALILGFSAVTAVALPLWLLLVLAGTGIELVVVAVRLRGWKRRRGVDQAGRSGSTVGG